MPMPKGSEIAKPGQIKTTPVIIEDIMPGTDTDNFGKTYPYRFRFVNKEGDIISEQESVGTMRHKIWFKKFYVNRESGYINYSHNECFPALLKILDKEGKIDLSDKSAEINVNKVLIGYEFEAAIIDSDAGRFINWYLTLEANGVEVPHDIKEIPGAYEKQIQQDLDTREHEAKGKRLRGGGGKDIIDPEKDLPF